MSARARRRPQIRPLVTPQTAVSGTRHLQLLPSPPGCFEQQELGLDFRRLRTLKVVETVAPTFLRQRAQAAFEDVGEPCEDELFQRQPTPASQLPSAEAWSRTLAQAVAEVVMGKRPARQVAKWVTPQLGSRLADEFRGNQPIGNARTRPDRIAVSSIHVDEPADGVAEVAAVIVGRRRSRALMMRLEGWDGRWICTVAQMI